MSLVLDEKNDIFTLINLFTVRPENQQKLIDLLVEFTEGTTRFLPGYVGVAVHKGLDGRSVANYVQWQTREHLQGMLQLPESKRHLEQVASLAEQISPTFYSVIYSNQKTQTTPS